MPAGFDVEHRLGDDRRPHVVARAGQLGEAGQHVDLGERVGGGLQSRGGGGDQLAQLRRTGRSSSCFGLLLGGEDFLFVFLELAA